MSIEWVELNPPADEREMNRRIICGEKGHPLDAGGYNARMDLTFCRCGTRRVTGNHTTFPRDCPTCFYGDGPCTRLNGCDK